MTGLILAPQLITPVGYTQRRVVFDGSNDYMARGADLDGNADSKVGLLSMWLDFQGGDASQQTLWETVIPSVLVFKNTSNKIIVRFRNGAAEDILVLTSSTSITVASGLTHVLASWNLATPVAHLYIDDADDEAGGSTETDDTINYTDTDHFIGARSGGSLLLNAHLGDFYFERAYLDITSAPNRRNFIDPSGNPANPGNYGGSPIMLFQGPASGFETNLGSGGNFTVTGSLTDA